MAYSVMWAPLRRMVSQVPSPVDRLGTDEKAKITAAHAKTGSHTVRTRDLATAADASLRRQTGERQGNPVQVRNGPAAVRGDAPAPHATGPRAGKAVGEGAPSQKTSARRQTRTPRGREDSCSIDSSSFWPPWPQSSCSPARQPR